MKHPRTICLVTEELGGYHGSGGIGAAFYELALLLSQNGYHVDILYVPISPLSKDEEQHMHLFFREKMIRLHVINDHRKYAFPEGYPSKSYCIYRHLKDESISYDAIHFHDYKGLGFFSTKAKKQKLAFDNTVLVTQLHGPTEWTIHTNKTLFTHEDQLTIDFMERDTIAKSDFIVSPSSYLTDFLVKHGFTLPSGNRTLVLKNVCADIDRNYRTFSRQRSTPGSRVLAKQIVFLGRHENRKGIHEFCDAMDLLSDRLSRDKVSVAFVGRFGRVKGHHSGVYLARRAARWDFPVTLYTGLDRNGVARFLAANSDAIVVIPSEENSPYTVLEALVLGKPLLTAIRGGARELIAPEHHEDALCEIDGKSIAAKLNTALDNGAIVPALAEDIESISNRWLRFHESILQTTPSGHVSAVQLKPKVVLGITHFERPHKLAEAIMSAIMQDYHDIQIVVVDDGSESPETLAALEKLKQVLSRANVRLIRQENQYLGAARNTIARETQSEYLCFLDDDDLAFPSLVSTLVRAAEGTGADIVNCLNVYMDESQRRDTCVHPEAFADKRISYFPTGGPLSLAFSRNNLGAATALIRRSIFEKVGGYSELNKVGHEDYEFFLKALQLGACIEVCPEPLYLYEVGRPSMISQTSTMENFRRTFFAAKPGENLSEWHKLASLVCGTNAASHEINRIDWEYRNDTHAELILPLHRNQLAPEEEIASVEKYASELGAPVILRPDSFSDEGACVTARRRSILEVLKERDKQAAATDLDEAWGPAPEIDIPFELISGRWAQFLARVDSKMVTTGSLSSRDVELLKLLLQKAPPAELDAHLVERLLSHMGTVLVDDDIVPDVLLLDTMLKFAVGLLDDARRSFVALRKLEETDYLNYNPDVAAAVEKGQLRDGLHHFAKAGLVEQRKGFKCVRELFALLRKHRSGINSPLYLDKAFEPMQENSTASTE